MKNMFKRHSVQHQNAVDVKESIIGNVVSKTLPVMPIIDGNHGYNYRELAEVDDLATALTVDCYLGMRTHKMFKESHELTHHQKDKVKSMIKKFSTWPDYEETFSNIVSEFKFSKLDQYRADPRFKRHMFRFFYLFDPRTGVQIRTCTRYVHENKVGAAIFATKGWCRDERLFPIVGCIAELKVEEEHNFLRPKENDFSVMFSSRKKCSQLWLGPAAYVNHDCKPNCQFTITCTGDCKMSMKVLRPIQQDDEILVYYGSHFFDQNNSRCECVTCELLFRGAFEHQTHFTTRLQTRHSNKLNFIGCTIFANKPFSQSSSSSYSFRNTDSRLDKLRRSHSALIPISSSPSLNKSDISGTTTCTLKRFRKVKSTNPSPINNSSKSSIRTSRASTLQLSKNKKSKPNDEEKSIRKSTSNSNDTISTSCSRSSSNSCRSQASAPNKNSKENCISVRYLRSKSLQNKPSTDFESAPIPKIIKMGEIDSRKRHRIKCSRKHGKKKKILGPPSLHIQMPQLEAEEGINAEEEKHVETLRFFSTSTADHSENETGVGTPETLSLQEPSEDAFNEITEEVILISSNSSDTNSRSANYSSCSSSMASLSSLNSLKLKLIRVKENEYRVLTPINGLQVS